MTQLSAKIRRAAREGEPRAYNDIFDEWARDVVDYWNSQNPDAEPFDLAKFDGCTVGLDVCRHCCLLHDLHYHFRKDRRVADKLLFECIRDIGRHEDRFGWVWTVKAWAYWAAVRIFGGWAW